MNLALLWCWKEWRAQRALLGAYSLLVFASLACVFLLVSDEFWTRAGGAHALGWFVGAGVIGVIAFAVPQLVRGEFAAKEDTFARRLPGALLPAFGGKLLFLVLVAAALPLLGLGLGELFLTATGHPWYDLFPDHGNAYTEVSPRWPEVIVWGAWAMLLVPWVWVLATWLPGGRMALGGAVLMTLLLALGAFAVFRRCEGLAGTLAWQPWAIASVPFGLALAGISWVRGRRGGGNVRSARTGLPLLALGLAPPAAWLGCNAYEYHHPDLDNLAFVLVEGLTPDQRFAIGRGTAKVGWQPVPLRFDLEAGTVEQIGGVETWYSRDVLRPYVIWTGEHQRYWRLGDRRARTHELYDLQTGDRWSVDYDSKPHEVILPPALLERVTGERSANWPFRGPDGVRANVVGGELLIGQPDGSVRREPWPAEWRKSSLLQAGHGILVSTFTSYELYDLTLARKVAPPGISNPGGYAVRGVWVMPAAGGASTMEKWQRFDSGRGTLEPCPEMKGAAILSLFDDDRLLCERHSKHATALFLYRPADREVTGLRLPEEFRTGHWNRFNLAAWTNPRGTDRLGRLWLSSRPVRGVRPQVGWIRIDPATLTVEAQIVPKWLECGTEELVDVVDERTVLVRQGSQIERVDTGTGARTILFPRSR